MAEELRIDVKLKDLASKELRTLQAGVGNFATRAVGSFKGVADSLLTVKGALAAIAASRGLALLKEGVGRAGDIESVSLAFKNLTQEVGGSVAVLEALRKGTRGTVADFKLMETANKAILLDVAQTADQFEELTTIARRLGRAVGRDTLESFNDLATGIGRQSRLILDNLGLIVKEEDAYKKYAARLGKTVTQLTDAEKKQAFLNATMEAARERVGSLGEDIVTLNDELGRLKTELVNAGDALLQELTPALAAAAGTAAEFLKNIKEVGRNVGLGVSDEEIAKIKEDTKTIEEEFKRQADARRKFLEPLIKQARVKVGLPAERPEAISEQEFARMFRILRGTEELNRLIKEHGKIQAEAAAATKKAAEERVELAIATDYVIDSTKQAAAQDKAYALVLKEQSEAAEKALEPLLELNRQQAANIRQLELLRSPLEGARSGFAILTEESKNWGLATTAAILDVQAALAGGLSDGLMDLVEGTKSVKDAFKDMARAILKDIARIIIQTLILKAVQAGLGGIGGAISGGIYNTGAGLRTGAKGMAVDKGDVLPFAQGVVVNAPTMFPLSGGRRGLMGEAGPEGILPLRRGPGGRLGVEASGGGMSLTVNVVYNVQGSLIGEKALFDRHKDEIAAATAKKMRESAGYRESMRAA